MAKTLKDLAVADLEKIAKKLQEQEPGLTKEQAITKALMTETGQAIYALHESDVADQPAEVAKVELQARAKLEKLGWTDFGDAVCEIAKSVSPDDIAAGMQAVKERYPNLYAAYERETGGAKVDPNLIYRN